MQLSTIRGGWGRNRHLNIENGDIQVRDTNLKHETILRIEDGLIMQIEEIENLPRNKSCRVISTNAWGGHRKSKSNIKKTILRFDYHNQLPENGVFFEMSGLKIGRYRGTLRQISKRSRFVREEFVYDNGRTAYVWTAYRKHFQVVRPNGRLLMEITAKTIRPYKRSTNQLERINTTLVNIAQENQRWSHEPNYEVTLYDRNTKLCGYGKVENSQRVGIWRYGRKRHYFMSGVKVERRFYIAKPEKLDPREILQIQNAQLRASLMKKIGAERLTNELPFVCCDMDGDNKLLKAEVKQIFSLSDESLKDMRAFNRLDEVLAIAMLKCPSTGQFYYLRVPPALKKVEHARQWLCGVDIEDVEVEYVKDRWMGLPRQDESKMTASQKAVLNAQIDQAAKRQKLVFLSEA